MAGIDKGQGQLVFGLDIGTRSIVGTVGYMGGSKFHVLAQRSREHETRAMLDGQIHDIAKGGETISQVKKQLEEDLSRELSEVCIAAAGRVLRTVTTYVEQDFEGEHEVTEEDIYSLSTLGMEKAYEEFRNTNDMGMKFFCVGYTPMRYYMNGYQIGNLEGHKARTIAVDLIATFLPDDVVDGLYKAVGLAGLHVNNLTLEPIAAIQVAIPEKYRMLNMALVDVGAGTSDISITKEGTITAYGMIPLAGDSLTDVIVQHCLVDFETAEQIKRSVSEQESVTYQDIIGLPQTITSKEVMEILEPSIDKMAELVAKCIMELNGDKAVSAVFVVGGGGTIPGYTDKLAQKLGIVKERVAIRGQEVMQNIIFEADNARRDSLMVTPIGICISYYEQSNNFIFVEFNKVRVKLYDNGRLSVADAAMQAQFDNEDLFPKRGKALTIHVNGKARMVRGAQGEAAVILVNGESADLYTKIHGGDQIQVTPSTAGDAASLELGRLPELAERLCILVNGRKIELPRTAEVNGKRENEFYQVKDGDDIQVRNYYTVREIAGFLDVPLGGNIRVNDIPAKSSTRVYENFAVGWNMDGSLFYEEEEEEEDLEGAVEEDTAEEEPAGAEKQAGAQPAAALPETVKQGAAPQAASGLRAAGAAESMAAGPSQGAPAAAVSGDSLVVKVNGQPVVLTGKLKYVFVDVFEFIEFDLNDSGGRGIVTLLNGRQAEYMAELAAGDVIEIYWK